MELSGYAAVGLGLLLLFILSKCFLLYQPNKILSPPPGPPAWPIIGHLHLLGKLPHQSLAKLSHKYGPLMFLRLGSVRTAVVSNAAIAREFLKTYDQIFASRPKGLCGKILGYNYSDIASAEYGPIWRNARKVCQLELFSPKRMEASKHIRMEEVYCMVRSIRVKGEGGKAVDVHSQVFALTLNIIIRMVLNKKSFASDSKEALEFKETISDCFYLSGAFVLGDYFPYMGWLDIHGYKRRMKAARKRVDLIMDAILQEHRQNKLEVSADLQSLDLIDVLLSLGNNENYERFSMDNVKAIVIDMFGAGTDTSALTIEWALSEILLKSPVQKKAQEELDQVVGRDRKVEESDVPQLKYLQAIVKETFRLHPAAPLLLPHESKEAVVVAGYAIPAKVHLLVNVWAMGRDSARWDRPLEFDPERFLDSSIDVRGQDFELIPFGSGRRACPGMAIGLISVQLGLAALLQSFEWSLPPSVQELDMTEEFGLTLPKSVPLHAMALPRLPQHLY